MISRLVSFETALLIMKPLIWSSSFSTSAAAAPASVSMELSVPASIPKIIPPASSVVIE